MWVEQEREWRKGEAGERGAGSGVRGRKCIHWWRMCWSTLNSTRGRGLIRFGTFNIRNGRNGGLELALRGMFHTNMDLGIFQETKVTDGVTPAGQLGTVSLIQTSRADTTAEWQCSTGRNHISRWRPSIKLGLTLSACRWRQGSGGGTLWDVTSPAMTPRR